MVYATVIVQVCDSCVCCVLLQVNSAFVVNLHYAFQSSDKLYLIMDLMNGKGWGNQRAGACTEGGLGPDGGCVLRVGISGGGGERMKCCSRKGMLCV